MSVYQKIKKLLDINHMTISQLSKISGVPVSTIYSLKKRDSNTMNLETLKKISDAFGVNGNYFVGTRQNASINLSAEEEALVLKIRALDHHGIKVVNSVINLEFDRIDKNAEVKVKVNVGGEKSERAVIVNIDELDAALKDIK